MGTTSTSNQVLMLSSKNCKSIGTEIGGLSIMFHFQLAKFFENQNQKLKSNLSLPQK